MLKADIGSPKAEGWKLNASGRLIQCTTLYKQTAGNQFSCNVYTHSTSKLFPLVETASPPRLDLSPGGPERGQLTPMPFSGVERPHRASVPPIHLQRDFPCLVGHREGTLSRVWSRFQARAAFFNFMLESLTQTGWLS